MNPELGVALAQVAKNWPNNRKTGFEFHRCYFFKAIFNPKEKILDELVEMEQTPSKAL